MYKRIFVMSFMVMTVSGLYGAEAHRIKIGALAFGTLNWEISVIREQGLDRIHGIAVEVLPLASAETGRVALQGGSADLIVGDWIWVAHQRAQNLDFTFVPYSTSHGALMVAADSPIREVADLAGKRLGIAGGGLDKNWLLLQALARKNRQPDLDGAVEKVFGAPPLLNQQLQQGKLDAVLNYWNHAAKLEALGYRRILDGREILRGLGITAEVPVLGYIFREGWAKSNAAALSGFLQAADQARKLICESDAVWHKVAPLTQESDEKVQNALRRHYCAGRITRFGTAEQQAVAEIYSLLAAGYDPLAKGSGGVLPKDVFWSLPGVPPAP